MGLGRFLVKSKLKCNESALTDKSKSGPRLTLRVCEKNLCYNSVGSVTPSVKAMHLAAIHKAAPELWPLLADFLIDKGGVSRILSIG
jgi:hypothetical protein